MTTLHAESATHGVTRLVEMRCPTYLLASALDVLLAQRLVRQICPDCRVEHEYGESIRTHLHRAGILPREENVPLYKGEGCERCAQVGCRGRVAVLEALRMTDPVREAVGGGMSGPALRRLATENKALFSFKQYSAYLLRHGLTTPSEPLRFFGDDM
jgi:type II secretory ATPase GspE/PulE/Tfp pilus assembly ATPase PilB-like protein